MQQNHHNITMSFSTLPFTIMTEVSFNCLRSKMFFRLFCYEWIEIKQKFTVNVSQSKRQKKKEVQKSCQKTWCQPDSVFFFFFNRNLTNTPCSPTPLQRMPKVQLFQWPSQSKRSPVKTKTLSFQKKNLEDVKKPKTYFLAKTEDMEKFPHLPWLKTVTNSK